ncbi:hypothetical protein [Spongiimicrobium sp. 2-473A-2-J]|uniref:hypothetical protein n=1 Tax=Eudoraea algarum TaxID=3417568 RepID=UPI003D36B2CD
MSEIQNKLRSPVSLLPLFWLLWGCTPEVTVGDTREAQLTLKPPLDTYTAGDDIILEFQPEGVALPKLLIQNVWGTSVLSPIKKDNRLVYIFPRMYSRKAGNCHWQLLLKGKMVQNGSLQIRPNEDRSVHLETYMGPRSMMAGHLDHTMLVAVATDLYDNPVPQGRPVNIQYQSNTTKITDSVLTQGLVAWKRIPTRPKAGRILVSAAYQQTRSKELTANVFPALAEDFSIEAERTHPYADGHQSVSLVTSIIEDSYGNTVSDGTLVRFVAETGTGALLHSLGTTINGRAQAKLLHPQEADSWTVKAYITGAAESNPISLYFDRAVQDLALSSSEDQRKLTVGPLRSFMGQLIPDGMQISVHVHDPAGRLLERKTTTTRKGLGIFQFPKAYFGPGTYLLEVRAGGMVQKQTVTWYE